MVYNNDMTDKQATSTQTKDTYLVHLEGGTVSVVATSLSEAIKLANLSLKDNKEKSNG